MSKIIHHSHDKTVIKAKIRMKESQLDYYLKHGYSNSEIVNLQREISKLRSKL